MLSKENKNAKTPAGPSGGLGSYRAKRRFMWVLKKNSLGSGSVARCSMPFRSAVAAAELLFNTGSGQRVIDSSSSGSGSISALSCL